MPWFDICWLFPSDVDDIEDSNVYHIGLHGLSTEDVEWALQNPLSEEQSSDASGRPLIFGPACDGRIIAVIYEWLDDGVSLFPITAFPVEKGN